MFHFIGTHFHYFIFAARKLVKFKLLLRLPKCSPLFIFLIVIFFLHIRNITLTVLRKFYKQKEEEFKKSRTYKGNVRNLTFY